MRPRRSTERLTVFGMVGQLGFIMAGSAVAGLLVGLWLDQLLGTGVAMTIGLLLLGIAGGAVAVYRLVMRAVTVGDTDEGEKGGGIGVG